MGLVSVVVCLEHGSNGLLSGVALGVVAEGKRPQMELH